jgi:hypothetical protein
MANSIRLQSQICPSRPQTPPSQISLADPRRLPPPYAFPWLSSGLLQTRRPSRMPTTRTLRPDKCLVVSPLAPELRPGCPRNTGANAVTTRIIYARPTNDVIRALLPQVFWLRRFVVERMRQLAPHIRCRRQENL